MSLIKDVDHIDTVMGPAGPAGRESALRCTLFNHMFLDKARTRCTRDDGVHLCALPLPGPIYAVLFGPLRVAKRWCASVTEPSDTSSMGLAAGTFLPCFVTVDKKGLQVVS